MKITVDYTEKIRQIENAAEWMESLGLNVKNTRYISAKKIVSNGIRDKEISQDEMVTYQTAAQELDDFILVHKFLSETSSPPIETLAKSLKGCLDSSAEKPNTGISGRNFVFELVIASRFAMCGCDVRFEGDADCIVNVEGFDIFIESKRSIGNDADAGIKDAFKQIEKRCAEGTKEKSFGIPAVCYTPIMQKEAQERGPIFTTEEVISKNMLESSSKFNFSRYKTYCPPGLGVITHFSVPFWDINQDFNLSILRRTNLHRLIAGEHPALSALKRQWFDVFNEKLSQK